MFEPNYKIVSTANTNLVKAVGVCVITNTSYETSEFTLSAFNAWSNGSISIQNTNLVHLSADDREFLISGVSPIGFNSLNNN
tara:strand:+ start:2899 stop:3144 length:246 start_codon:yes stop_codon:yes gene_type:complete